MQIVYILSSEKFPNRYYIGTTEDLQERLAEHNDGKSSYTSKYAPWKLQTYIRFRDKEKAEKFEKYLKSGSGFDFLKKHLI